MRVSKIFSAWKHPRGIAGATRTRPAGNLRNFRTPASRWQAKNRKRRIGATGEGKRHCASQTPDWGKARHIRRRVKGAARKTGKSALRRNPAGSVRQPHGIYKNARTAAAWILNPKARAGGVRAPKSSAWQEKAASPAKQGDFHEKTGAFRQTGMRVKPKRLRPVSAPCGRRKKSAESRRPRAGMSAGKRVRGRSCALGLCPLLPGS